MIYYFSATSEKDWYNESGKISDKRIRQVLECDDPNVNTVMHQQELCDLVYCHNNKIDISKINVHATCLIAHKFLDEGESIHNCPIITGGCFLLTGGSRI